ncbi:MAG: hypothetical protein AB7O96_09805 [Pseudobdellovibrionaceae bacterium]
MDQNNSNTTKKRLPSSHVRFTEKEFEIIQKMQQTTGLSIPDLLKKALFKRIDLIRPLISKEDVEKIMTELRCQGRNINQITTKINSGLMSGWSQSFNSLVRVYVDLRHIISLNSAKALENGNR